MWKGIKFSYRENSSDVSYSSIRSLYLTLWLQVSTVAPSPCHMQAANGCKQRVCVKQRFPPHSWIANSKAFDSTVLESISTKHNTLLTDKISIYVWKTLRKNLQGFQYHRQWPLEFPDFICKAVWYLILWWSTCCCDGIFNTINTKLTDFEKVDFPL